MFFFIPTVGDLLEIEEYLHLTAAREADGSPIQSGNIGVFLSLYHFGTLLLKTGVFASPLHHRY